MNIQNIQSIILGKCSKQTRYSAGEIKFCYTETILGEMLLAKLWENSKSSLLLEKVSLLFVILFYFKYAFFDKENMSTNQIFWHKRFI